MSYETRSFIFTLFYMKYFGKYIFILVLLTNTWELFQILRYLFQIFQFKLGTYFKARLYYFHEYFHDNLAHMPTYYVNTQYDKEI